MAGQRCAFTHPLTGGKGKERVRGSVNKAVDVLIPQHDRASLFLLSVAFPSARDEARWVAGFREREGETVIIKSCNQLANLSSSVLIKPGPPGSFSLVRFLPFPISRSLFLSLHLSFSFALALVSFYLRMRNYSYHFALRVWRRQFFISRSLRSRSKLFLGFFINSREKAI